MWSAETGLIKPLKIKLLIFLVLEIGIYFVNNFLDDINLKNSVRAFIRADILRVWKVNSKGFNGEVEQNSYLERPGFFIK